jgi:gliding-associated putative ABC transporter substrate-binding component GldG
LISLSENKNAPEDEKFKMNNIPSAVLLEGKFRSLYQNRISGQKADSLAARGTPFLDQSVIENRMIVIADGDIVLNEFSARQGQVLPMGVNQYTIGTNFEYQFANRDFILNCLEYLLSDGGIMETRNKDFVLRVLDTKKVSEQKTFLQLTNIGLPVLLVVISGFIYQQIRKRKYAA